MEPKFNNANKNPIAVTRLRMAKGMTRAQLAELTGINMRAIENWEQRRVPMHDVPVGKVLAVAKVLGCTIEELIDD